MQPSSLRVGKWSAYDQLITQSLEQQSAEQARATVGSRRGRTQELAVTFALTLMLTALWLLTHRYSGIALDAHLYAFQALARIHTALRGDLSLQYSSQDQYTIFSPFYAMFIGWFGVESAARSLTLLFNIWILVAAWHLARHLTNRATAWLAVASLIIASRTYGANGVFHFSEPFLTARLPAEALIVTAFACYFRGLKKIALAAAVLALFVHPLMAFPGLLVLICLWLSGRLIVIGAVAGTLAALAVAVAALYVPAASRLLTVMDPLWLEVVRERSQFLFLQYWSTHDWEVNARPFISLTLTAMAMKDPRIRKLCLAAMLVGGSGLALALISSVVAPVAILLQGQAWRWVWIAGFVGVLLLPPTAVTIWRDKKCGPICAMLLLLGWTFPVFDGVECVSAALVLWSIRSRISDRLGQYLRWAAIALGAILVVWTMGNSWTIISSTASESGRESAFLIHIRNILGLGVPAVFLVWLLWWWARSAASPWVPALISAALLVCSAFSIPSLFRQYHLIGDHGENNEFADWTERIPPASTVLVVPARDSGSFVWFDLGRPNYLSIDQSAGAVFSRAIALEIRRRSDVLLPLMDPNWKILTTNLRGGSGKHKEDSSRPLTRESLVSVCGDEKLGFVIAPQNVGFDPVRHTGAGRWKDWNLYDCRQVRSLESTV